ncbi:non-ribosomal peptide synthetase, partial [Paenibacillus albidus]|uniref:non-ribosomal peptide synthetase n=1 Tax=Paenibacillus albidus TaxID=2041023 RepID=UPI001E3603AA
MVEHRNVVRLVRNTNYITFEEGDRILQTGAQVFDACTYEIWGALLNGLELYVIDKATILNPQMLEASIKANQITIMWLTAPLFDQLALESPTMFEGLRTLIVGGDVLTPKIINQVRKTYSGLQVVNGYGPTENTTFSVCYLIDRDIEMNIPIGRPISNSNAYIVDCYGKIAPIGVPGELWVGGDGVARGYKNLDELTAEKFIPNPFADHARLYRTGDLAKWLPGGDIEFLGRMDDQLKIRGYRIEVGEIEREIIRYEFVKEAIVVAKEWRNGQKSLCAYVVPTTQLSADDIREYLVGKLPDYMVPSYYVTLDRLPLNQNGKVDRKALPEPESGFNTEEGYVAPQHSTEKKLAEIWQEILGVPRVGLRDHFFGLGGHSLKAVTLVSRVSKELQVNLSLGDVFKAPILSEMATLIRASEVGIYAAIEQVPKAE